MSVPFKTASSAKLVESFRKSQVPQNIIKAISILTTVFGLVALVAATINVVGGSAGTLQLLIATAASGLIGSVTFLGSLIAFGKLQGLITEKPLRYPGEQIVKSIVFIAAVTLGVLLVKDPSNGELYWYLASAGALLGILLVLPIGGADMPIVIALLNSYSGLAAAATGFVLSNNILIIAGSLVGASGIILTTIMCKAMNRSLLNVLFGGVGAIQAAPDEGDIYAGKIKKTASRPIIR